MPDLLELAADQRRIQVESEASETTVIVTALPAQSDVGKLGCARLPEALSARQLRSPDACRPATAAGAAASARFRDEEGDNWFVRFISNGQTLVLATCHTNRPLTSREGKTGVAVLDSIKLKARG